MSSIFLRVNALLFCLFLISQVQASCVWIGGDSNWDDPANWSCGYVPGALDEIEIAGGTVDMDISAAVDKAIFSGGTVAGGGVLAIAGSMDWKGGTIAGTVDLDAGASLSLSTPGAKIVSGDLNISPGALVNWLAGTLTLDGGLIDNKGTFVIEFDAMLTSAIGTFLNAGVLDKAVSGGTAVMDASVVNDGMIRIISGTLQFPGSLDNAGAIVIYPTSTLESYGGTTFDMGTTIDSTGTLAIGASSLTTFAVSLDNKMAIHLESSSAELRCNAPIATSGDITFAAGLLSGSEGLLAEGEVDWTSGTIAAGTILSIAADANLLMTSFGEKKVEGTLGIAGTATWTASSLLIEDGGLLDISGSLETTFNGSIGHSTASPGSMNISGTFTKNGGGDVTEIRVPCTNSGTISASLDTLEFNEAVVNSGELNVPSGGYIFFDGSCTLNSGTTTTGSDGIDFNGTTEFNTAITSPNNIGFLGASISVNALFTSTNKLFIQSGDKVGGSGSLSCSGDVDWVEGTLEIPMTIGGTSTLEIYTTEDKTLKSTLTQNGTTTLFTGALFNIDSPGKFVNNGTFTFNSSADISTDGVAGEFENAGTSRFLELSTTSTLNISLTNNGTIEGIGTVDPTVSFTNNGIVSPGNSPGQLVIDHEFTNGTKLIMELEDDSGAGSGHDQLVVNDITNLQDTLEVIETGSVPDGTYTIITCSGDPNCIQGTFATLLLPSGYSIQYHNTSVDLIKSTVLPVTLVEFKGHAKASQVELTWLTASEKDHHYFSVERSTDGYTFYAIGQVNGRGDSEAIRQYTFTDQSIVLPTQDLWYYRLRSVDFSGDYAHSKIIAVSLRLDALAAFKINYIHVNNNQDIQVAYQSSSIINSRINIFGMNGQLLWTTEQLLLNGENTLILNHPELPNNQLYTLQIISPLEQYSQIFRYFSKN